MGKVLLEDGLGQLQEEAAVLGLPEDVLGIGLSRPYGVDVAMERGGLFASRGEGEVLLQPWLGAAGGLG